MSVPNFFNLAFVVFHSRPDEIAALRQACDETDALRNANGESDPRVQAGEVRANNLKGAFTRRIAWACHQQDSRFGLRRKTTGQIATRPSDGLTHSTDALMLSDTGQIIDCMSDRDVSWGVTDGDAQPLDQWVAPLPEGEQAPAPVPVPGPAPAPAPAPAPPNELEARISRLEELFQHLDERLTTVEQKPAPAFELPALVAEGNTGKTYGHAHPVRLVVKRAAVGILLALVLAAPAVAQERPNLRLTPGVSRAMSKMTLCTTKWGLDRRAVTVAMKKHVAAAYGIPWAKHSLYEFDHLISRELAGADDEKNLWPERWTGTWGARKKDRLENRLHKLVCDGTITLATAQQAIVADWIAAYQKYIVQ